MVVLIIVAALGALAGAFAFETSRARRRASDGAAWIAVSTANELLRADLDHLCGDDPNHGLRELRGAIELAAGRRSPAERALFERYNGLLGIAIAFGEKVHDAAGNIDMRAVAMRREHVRNALRLGERIEFALGGIAQLARDAERAAAPGHPAERRLRGRRRLSSGAAQPAAVLSAARVAAT
jgi:hypothetical protein